MNGISHKQAIKWIDRRQDGLLKGNQQSALEEHLRSCESCRAYSHATDSLVVQLRHEFQNHLDQDAELSQNKVRQIVSQARSIPTAKRFSANLQLAGGLTVLIFLAFVINFLVSQLRQNAPVVSGTQSASSFPLPENRLLAFTSDQSGNLEIYTMHADGSRLANLTNNPAQDVYPFWSPDGKQIAFVSDRDGSRQIYRMDADGSNVVQLTHGEGEYALDINGYSPWSPNGQKLIVLQKSTEDGYKLYAIDLTDGSATVLTNEPGRYLLPSWSPDGSHVAFLSFDESRSRQDLLVVDSAGNQVTKLTENLTGITDYEWTADGVSLLFSDNKKMYSSTVDGALTVIAESSDMHHTDWWVGGSVPLEFSDRQLIWIQPDGSRSTLDLCRDNGEMRDIAHKRSKEGNWIVATNCSTSGWMMYWASSDGTAIQPLPGVSAAKEESLLSLAWSPDDQYFAFGGTNINAPDITHTLYVVDVAKARQDASIQPVKMKNSFAPSWQPVVNENLVEEKSPARLMIDPQSCKPAEGDSVPSDLYGYDVIENTSFTDGDFTYDFWLYCDPALRPQDPEHFSAIAGLGIYSSWRYTGPQVDGPVRYYYAFASNDPIGTSGSDGPLYQASAQAKLGIDLPETKIQEYIQQAVPVQLSIVIESSLGQDGAVLSFNLEPAERGYDIANVKVGKLNHSENGLIAFTSVDENGNTDIFTVHADGSGLVNLTNNAAKESSLVWSPDGRRLAFSSDQDGNLDIFNMNADGSDLTRLTEDPGDEDLPFWSPNGKSIAYTFYESDGKTANLYVMDANGENQRRLTDSHPQPDAVGVRAERWSLDGKSIFYTEQDQVNKVNIESGEITSLPIRGHSFITLRNDSRLLYFSDCYESAGVFCFVPETIAEDGTGKETYQTIKIQEVCTTLDDPRARMMNFYYLAKWSPDRTKIMFHFNCGVGGQLFYTANADGSGFRPLISNYLPTGYPGLNNDIHFDWSPDSQSIIFTSSPDGPDTQDLFILRIEDAVTNPDFQPTPLQLSTFQASNLSWQPAP